ncbi:MAG TPA: PAS domain-containing protein [Bacteroidales bacterium]|nr:PAS domain-containing protein [Balneolales bacterium]HYX08703.1 PAS domain-containing protein [Bacteroidales bacterium]
MKNRNIISTFTRYLKPASENIISQFLNRISKLLYLLLSTLFSALLYWKFINPTIDIFLIIKIAILASSSVILLFILQIFQGYHKKLEYELINEQNHSSDLKKEIVILKRRLKEKQEQLSSYHKRFQTFLNYYQTYIQHTKDLIGIHDMHGRFSYISPAVTSMLGYPQTHLIGKNLTQVCHPDDLSVLENTFTFNGVKSKSSKIRFQCKDGKYKWVTIYTDLYQNPSFQRHILSTIQEISAEESGEYTYFNNDHSNKINLQ